jgi:hypothetical protein
VPEKPVLRLKAGNEILTEGSCIVVSSSRSGLGR